MNVRTPVRLSTIVTGLALCLASGHAAEASGHAAESSGTATATGAAKPAPAAVPAWGTYTATDDKAFRWDLTTTTDANGTRIIAGTVVSQEWHGTTWDHEVRIAVPKTPIADDLALVFIQGGFPKMSLEQIAAATGVACMSVSNVWNNAAKDPVATGMKALGGDLTWMPVCPFTKSVVKAMDAAEAASARDLGKPLRRFILTGHSKFGVTSWCAASIDPRVVGIMPSGADAALRTADQFDAFHTNPTPTGKAMDTLLGTPAGRGMMEAGDVYAYRQSLTMPKLIVQGTSDSWACFASTSLYWDGMPGANRLLLLPNTGHGSWEVAAAINARLAFTSSLGGGKPFPELKWHHGEAAGKRELRVTSTVAASGARMWVTTGPSANLRGAKWTSMPMEADPSAIGNGVASAWRASIDLPTSGYQAVFGELSFKIDGREFPLTTTIAPAPGK